jgi:hypothetical protein
MDRIDLNGVIVCKFRETNASIVLEFPAERFTGSKPELAAFFVRLGEFISNNL